jgi:hypothetical protein
VDRYQARVKRDRFDLDMLNRYCDAPGIKRLDEKSYGPQAVLHSEDGIPRAHPNYPPPGELRPSPPEKAKSDGQIPTQQGIARTSDKQAVT